MAKRVEKHGKHYEVKSGLKDLQGKCNEFSRLSTSYNRTASNMALHYLDVKVEEIKDGSLILNGNSPIIALSIALKDQSPKDIKSLLKSTTSPDLSPYVDDVLNTIKCYHNFLDRWKKERIIERVEFTPFYDGKIIDHYEFSFPYKTAIDVIKSGILTDENIAECQPVMIRRVIIMKALLDYTEKIYPFLGADRDIMDEQVFKYSVALLHFYLPYLELFHYHHLVREIETPLFQILEPDMYKIAQKKIESSGYKQATRMNNILSECKQTLWEDVDIFTRIKKVRSFYLKAMQRAGIKATKTHLEPFKKRKEIVEDVVITNEDGIDWNLEKKIEADGKKRTVIHDIVGGKMVFPEGEEKECANFSEKVIKTLHDVGLKILKVKDYTTYLNEEFLNEIGLKHYSKMKKNNGYAAVHCWIVVDEKKKLLGEVQITTRELDARNNYGGLQEDTNHAYHKGVVPEEIKESIPFLDEAIDKYKKVILKVKQKSGIDEFTLNNVPTNGITERLEKFLKESTSHFSKKISKIISAINEHLDGNKNGDELKISVDLRKKGKPIVKIFN